MSEDRARIWYLLEWNDRDKCLLMAVSLFLLVLAYWILVDLVATHTDLGTHYVSDTGIKATQWVFLASEFVLLCPILWGWWLRRCNRESNWYVTIFLYSFGPPLIAIGHMVGLYNPLLGVMLLGAGLTGTILFDFRRIIGPFIFAVTIVTILAWLTVNSYLEYSPLLRLDPVSKFHVSGEWISLIMFASAPFVLGAFGVTFLLLNRWHEREEMVRLLSNTDQLTGLPNRRSLFDKAEHELQRAKRNGEPLALAMMDLDHFKQVNDTWGHAAGDTVLRQTGQLLPTLLRSVDVLGRVGGEEFVIVLPQTSADAARQVLERCRSALETTPVVLEDGRQLSVTASFGLCHAHATNHTTLQQLLESADLALYRAKHAGRNRVESASLS